MKLKKLKNERKNDAGKGNLSQHAIDLNDDLDLGKLVFPSEKWQLLGVKNVPVNVTPTETQNALVDSEALNFELKRSNESLKSLKTFKLDNIRIPVSTRQNMLETDEERE